MKGIIKFRTVVCILFAAALASCGKDEEEWHEAQFEMVVAPNADTRTVAFYATAKKITIDWGDGVTEEFTAEKEREFTHSYSELDWQTISVTAEGLTKLAYGLMTFVSVGILEELDLKNCQDLIRLVCHNQDLTDLDLKHCPNLTYLDCRSNRLESLDITKNMELYYLNCFHNHLTVLDVSKLPKLEVLDCTDNQLTSLEVSNNKILRTLQCTNNQLISLDIGKNTKMITCYCEDNRLSADELNNLMNNLPMATQTATISSELVISGNPGSEDCDTSIAIKKGWILLTQ